MTDKNNRNDKLNKQSTAAKGGCDILVNLGILNAKHFFFCHNHNKKTCLNFIFFQKKSNYFSHLSFEPITNNGPFIYFYPNHKGKLKFVSTISALWILCGIDFQNFEIYKIATNKTPLFKGNFNIKFSFEPIFLLEHIYFWH